MHKSKHVESLITYFLFLISINIITYINLTKTSVEKKYGTSNIYKNTFIQ